MTRSGVGVHRQRRHRPDEVGHVALGPTRRPALAVEARVVDNEIAGHLGHAPGPHQRTEAMAVRTASTKPGGADAGATVVVFVDGALVDVIVLAGPAVAGGTVVDGVSTRPKIDVDGDTIADTRPHLHLGVDGRHRQHADEHDAAEECRRPVHHSGDRGLQRRVVALVITASATDTVRWARHLPAVSSPTRRARHRAARQSPVGLPT